MADRDEILVRAQTTIRDLRARLATAEQLRPEPVAIVGMACRFPGAPTVRNEDGEDLEAFWRTTLAGRSAEQVAPEGRWTGDPAASVDRRRPPFRASFLKDVDLFDAGFFDIPPSEAMEMDPAQRLFLEVAWRALEDAGQTRERLAGSDTGVFVGYAGFHEYLRQHMAAGAEIGVYTGTGNGEDVIAGRLSYCLNLHGPAMTVNTGCSSSLVAIHLARRSLLAGECRMAVAGGVNILGPVSTALAMQMGFMAPDGRCKAFDERADGYGRGEGCGVVVLKRLSDAESDGDLIRAVIHGSAVNQDGRSNGLTAPNGRSQTALLRRALRDAGIAASQVGYVEAHGTGTSLGDLIEFEALAAVYGLPQQGSLPCSLGSAKANIGHQEGAAGVAGLLRAVLAIEHGVIPPLAGFRTLNPNISLEGTRLAIPVESVAWSGAYAARFAGVSSFGWSGTNAHIVVGAVPATPAPNRRNPPPVPHAFQRSRYWIPMRESAVPEKVAPDDWFYETVWKEMPLPLPLRGSVDQMRNSAAKWLIFADATGVAQQLAGAIAERGDSFVLIWPGATFHQRSANEFEADPTDLEQIELVLRQLASPPLAFPSLAFPSKEFLAVETLFVVHLQALDLDPPQVQDMAACPPYRSAMEKCLEALIRLCQELAKAAPGRTTRLWAVTRGAQAVQSGDMSHRPEQAPIQGFASAAALEHPDFWAGTVDLPSDAFHGDVGPILLRECETATKENRVAYRDGRRFVPRLLRAEAPPAMALRFEPDAVYLVTGAFGGVGLDIAEWLAENGATHLVLLGRSGGSEAPETQRALHALKEAGVHLSVERCDVGDFRQMSALFVRLASERLPVRGIVHAAAEVIWKPIVELNADDVRRSFQAKVRGSLVLHELTKRMPLDFLVFFSSAAVSIGARNAAAYAAANSFMDALAFERRSAGLPGLSIHWGHWKRRTRDRGVLDEHLTSSGLAAMPAVRALNALGRLLYGPGVSASRQLTIAQIDVGQLKAGIGTRTDSLFLSDLDASPQRAGELSRPAAIAALDGLPEADRIEPLTLLVVQLLRRALDWNAAQPVDLTRGFFDMGMDSLQSIQFENSIEAATGTIQPTLAFLYPNVDAVAKFLDRSLFGGKTQQAVLEPSRPSAAPIDPVETSLTEAETHAALLAELELFNGGRRG